MSDEFGLVRIECPTVKAWERARSRPDGGRFHTKELTAATDEWKWLGLEAMAGRPPTLERLRVDVQFRLPTKRRVDIDNLCKLPMDALNQIVWHDDSQVDELHTVKVTDQGNPGTTLIVAALRP